MEQLDLFQPPQHSATRRIIPRFHFDRSPEPIQLPHFHRDMLLVHEDDPIVFKTCDCGAVYAFNTQAAYDSLIVCYGCKRKMFARSMHWNLSKKTFENDMIMDWETCQLYRFGEGEAFGARLI